METITFTNLRTRTES